MNPNPPATPNQNTSSGYQVPNIKPPIFSKIINWARTHKKLAIAILILLLVTCSLLLMGNTILKRFFPGANQSSSNNTKQAALLSSSMWLKTTKPAFNQSEKIPVSVVTSSAGVAITGFDTVIEYDSNFLTLSKKNPPPLKNFDYYGKNDDKLISVSAVKKADAGSDITFDNTTIFDIEFTPKKKGKTILKVIYMPERLGDSNLINDENQDILGNARGIEITIN